MPRNLYAVQYKLTYDPSFLSTDKCRRWAV